MADTEAQEESATPPREEEAAEAGTSADIAGTPADKEAQILMEERETVSESVPGGMFGAVMVEVCVTLPRAR